MWTFLNLTICDRKVESRKGKRGLVSSKNKVGEPRSVF